MTRQEKINKVARFCAANDCGNCKAEHMCADVGYGTVFFRWSEASETTLDAMLAAIDAADKPTAQQPVTRDVILDAAKKCVSGDREQDYGNPEYSFKAIASMWNSYLYAIGLVKNDTGEWKGLKPKDIAAMMVLFKMARVATGHGKLDNWVDAAGYAANGGELEAQSISKTEGG